MNKIQKSHTYDILFCISKSRNVKLSINNLIKFKIKIVEIVRLIMWLRWDYRWNPLQLTLTIVNSTVAKAYGRDDMGPIGSHLVNHQNHSL